MNFTTAPTRDTSSRIRAAFENVVTAVETKEDSKIPAGHVGVIGDYRGYTMKSTQGRKSPLACQTVVNLASVERCSIEEIPTLIECLRNLARNFEEQNVQDSLNALSEDLRD